MDHSACVLGVVLTLSCLGLATANAEDNRQAAQTEYQQAMALSPHLERGRQIYLTCAVCHRPEGWGSPDGAYPQIAGQPTSFIIKQLSDIRAGQRDNPLMYPFSVPRILGGPQSIADVAAYIAALPVTPNNAQGPGIDLELGQQLYEQHCANCHGEQGEADAEARVPRLAGQHFPYLMRQFDAIRTARRCDSQPQTAELIRSFDPRAQTALLDYVSRLPVSPQQVAPNGWINPDFPAPVREPMGFPAPPPLVR